MHRSTRRSTRPLARAALLALSVALLGVAAGATPATAQGGGATPSCANDVTNVSVTSGGNRGGHTVVPSSMHVFVEYLWRPCVGPFERVDVTVTDAVSGVAQVVTPASFPWGQLGGRYTMAHHTSDALFQHPYVVVIRTSNQATGAVVSTVARTVTTARKL